MPRKGQHGPPMPDVTRAAIRKSHLGLPMTERTRLAVAKASIGSHRTEASKEANRLAHLGTKMSPETRAKMSVAHTGRRALPETRAKIVGCLNVSWMGGVSFLNTLIRHSLGYANWRHEVYARDDFTCQVCGKRGGDVVAHHINNFAEHEDKRFDVENGTTLCPPCNKKFHALFSERHNTLQELQTFVMTQEV